MQSLESKVEPIDRDNVANAPSSHLHVMKEEKSYKELSAILQNTNDAWQILGPQDSSKIEEIEKACGLLLPKSFKVFLVEVGAIEFPNHSYSGISQLAKGSDGGILKFTEIVKKENGLPDGLLVLEYDHDAEELACLDLNEMKEGECRVVWYDIYQEEISGICARSFDQFFRQLVKDWEAIKKEES